MRKGVLLVLLLGVIVAAAVSVVGWHGVRSRSAPLGPTGWYGVNATAAPPPAPPPSADGSTAATQVTLLPARVTVTWNVATQQAKVYVGQSFVGIVTQGGEQRAADKVERVVSAMRSSNMAQVSELDADGMIPLGELMPVLAALDAIPSGSVRPHLLAERPASAGPPPLGTKSLAFPEVDGARPVSSQVPPWVLALHPPTGTWSAGTHADALEAVEHTQLQAWFAAKMKDHPPGKTPVVLLALPKQMEWQHVLEAVVALRGAGITNLMFRVVPPAQPQPDPAGK